MKIFVPIKEYSQRVPRKNFRIFYGEPLYKHALLKFSKNQVYVDTDSEEVIKGIQDDARLGHVLTYKRSRELVGHHVSVCDLIKNFIKRFEVQEPIAQIHVTSPFLNNKLLEDAAEYMSNHDSVISCNIHHTRFWRKELYGYCPVNHNPVKIEQTQDLPPFYEENSAFYIFEPKVISSTGSRIGRNPYFYPIGVPHNIDIDTEEDWKIALNITEKEKR